MKLFVILICLLAERFFAHASSHQRFYWFEQYAKKVQAFARQKLSITQSWGLLAVIVLPFLLVAGIIYFISYYLLFGLIHLLFHIFVLYYCLGPGNVFFPEKGDDQKNLKEQAGKYLATANGQLFAVILWYIILGPIGALAYRMIALSQSQKLVGRKAVIMTDLLDWLPSKMTALLYLLVGNFQAGIHLFSQMLLTPPENNKTMLFQCGLEAINHKNQEEPLMPQAETLVDHAVIALLVLLSMLTIVAWL